MRGMAGIAQNLPDDLGQAVTLSPAFGVTLAVFSVVASVAVLFWLSVGVLAALDLLFAGSRRVRRLVECNALAYWSQVPWSLATALILFFWFDPEPLRLPAGVSVEEVTTHITEHQVAIQSSALMETMQIIGVYFGLWLAALQAAALRVVSGFSVGGAWAAGILLAALFVGIPYAGRLLW